MSLRAGAFTWFSLNNKWIPAKYKKQFLSSQ